MRFRILEDLGSSRVRDAAGVVIGFNMRLVVEATNDAGTWTSGPSAISLYVQKNADPTTYQAAIYTQVRKWANDHEPQTPEYVVPVAERSQKLDDVAPLLVIGSVFDASKATPTKV